MFAKRTVKGVITAAMLGVAVACVGEPTATPDVAPQLRPAATPSTVALTWFIPSAGEFGVRGDGLAAYTSTPMGDTRYKDKECVASATMFISGSGDAVMQNSIPNYNPKNCSGVYPRKVAFTLYTADPVSGLLTPSGGPAANPAYLIVLAVHKAGAIMPVVGLSGPWQLRDAGSNDGGRCGRLAFRPNLENGTPVGADKPMVRRLAADTWEVQSQPNTVDADGNVVRHDKAWCESENRLYSVPVHYIIKSATPLPTS